MKGGQERSTERPWFGEERGRVGLSGLEALSARDLGEAITDHRSSWVRRVQIGPTDCYVKTYDYPTIRDRVRGLFRTTFLAPSRARREWQALLWLRDHGFAAPEPLAHLECRRYGLLRRAVLVTEAYPGRSLDALLPSLTQPDRDDLLCAVESTVEALHRQGFRDGNLDLRNLLARRLDDGSWEIAKIDSPRHRLVSPDAPSHDHGARADWERLSASVAACLTGGEA